MPSVIYKPRSLSHNLPPKGSVVAQAIQYAGPGDVVPNAVMWWGLRAYSVAMAGTKAVRIRRDSDNTEQDFNTLSNGNLDIASISSFIGAANAFVTKLYDQSGNGRDLSQSTAGQQPQLQFSVLGSLPGLLFTAANNTVLNTASIISGSLPFTVSSVAKIVDNGVVQSLTVSNDGGSTFPNVYYNPGTPPVANMYNGNPDAGVNATNNSFHARQCLFTTPAANSIECLDGVDSSQNPNANAGWGGVTTYGGNSAAQYFNSFVNEIGYWASDIGATARGNMNSNQHTYWGF